MRALLRRWWSPSGNLPPLQCQEEWHGEREYSCTSGVTAEEARQRIAFVNLLWSVFPQARRENWSERKLAGAISARLGVEGRPTHWRTVCYWLRCDSAPGFPTFLKVVEIAGADLADFLAPEKVS